ncbi:PAS domain S-box-containing protein [Geothermobacter ehrlichii]|uniref:histidine kinase n=1 Tax=Geothermobacter ehrlichii TaxID=213224 RepID=A0A5D3WME0_9BACT|nr:HAMP domain-containing protein [Geothermobacter ehrlichii]TYO99659.1 PAS domain S-box-containing protein [Geothermobacter ehrlichii]
MLRSIRSRILASHLGIVLLVLVVLGPTAYYLLKGQLLRQRLANLNFLAGHMAGMVEQRLRQRESDLVQLVAGRLVQDFPETARVSALAEYFSGYQDRFPVIAYMDGKGWEELRVVRGRDLPYLGPFVDAGLFAAARERPNRVVRGTVMQSESLGEAVIPLMYGIRRYFGDEFVGAVYAQVTLADLTGFLRTIEVGRSGYLVLIDREGLILAYPAPGRVMSRLDASGMQDPVVAQALSGRSGEGKGRLFGVEALMAYAPVPDLNATLLAVLPMAEFMEAPRKLRDTILLVIGGLIVAATLLATLLASRLTRPLLALTQTVRRVAAGDLPEKLDIPTTGDEVDQLVESFGQMITELRHSMISRHYFDRILDSMGEGLVLIGLDGHIRTANQVACELIGLREQELVGRNLGDLFAGGDVDEEPWLQVLLGRPEERMGRKILRTATGDVPVRFVWTVLEDPAGRVQEVACLFAADIAVEKCRSGET